jgi:uncharacterized protein
MRVRPKHVPHRTCIACKEIHPKKSMIRIVRTPSGVIIDLEGKRSGRGTYLHNRRECWEIGIKGAIARALKTTLTDEDRDTLQAFLSSMADENNLPASSYLENLKE